jgi:hypothetical protein
MPTSFNTVIQPLGLFLSFEKPGEVAHAYIILATWEAEIGRISVQGQPKQIVFETSSPK